MQNQQSTSTSKFFEGTKVPSSIITLPQTAKWLGHAFNVYRHDGDWYAVGGVYVFAGAWIFPGGTQQWHPLYVGMTQDFASYLPTHRKWSEAVQLGATHVHALVVESKETRMAIEQEMIRVYQPPLNVAGK